MQKFEGIAYRTANNWFSVVDVNEYKNKPITYLEIGAFYGANLLSVADTYASHQDSKLFCIDPWEDYDDYTEYKDMQGSIYETFTKNVTNSPHRDKISAIRGYSHAEIHKFPDNFFDIVYIDGNHNAEYVLEDAVLCHRKLKNNGYMIFDDFGWGGPDLTQKGIECFHKTYCKQYRFLGIYNTQFFLKKK